MLFAKYIDCCFVVVPPVFFRLPAKIDDGFCALFFFYPQVRSGGGRLSPNPALPRRVRQEQLEKQGVSTDDIQHVPPPSSVSGENSAIRAAGLGPTGDGEADASGARNLEQLRRGVYVLDRSGEAKHWVL